MGKGKSELSSQAIILNMKDFMTEREKLNRIHESTINALKQYAGSEGYQIKKRAEDMRYSTLMLNLQNAYIKKHNSISKQLSNDINVIEVEDVPGSLSGDVAILENSEFIPEGMQQAYLRKYQHNYPAAVTIKNIIDRKNEGKDIASAGFVLRTEAVRNIMKHFDNEAAHLMTGRTTALDEAVLFRKGGEMEAEANKLDSFLSGNFTSTGSDAGSDGNNNSGE